MQRAEITYQHQRLATWTLTKPVAARYEIVPQVDVGERTADFELVGGMEQLVETLPGPMYVQVGIGVVFGVETEPPVEKQPILCTVDQDSAVVDSITIEPGTLVITDSGVHARGMLVIELRERLEPIPNPFLSRSTEILGADAGGKTDLRNRGRGSRDHQQGKQSRCTLHRLSTASEFA